MNRIILSFILTILIIPTVNAQTLTVVNPGSLKPDMFFPTPTKAPPNVNARKKANRDVNMLNKVYAQVTSAKLRTKVADVVAYSKLFAAIAFKASTLGVKLQVKSHDALILSNGRKSKNVDIYHVEASSSDIIILVCKGGVNKLVGIGTHSIYRIRKNLDKADKRCRKHNRKKKSKGKKRSFKRKLVKTKRVVKKYYHASKTTIKRAGAKSIGNGVYRAVKTVMKGGVIFIITIIFYSEPAY